MNEGSTWQNCGAVSAHHSFETRGWHTLPVLYRWEDETVCARGDISLTFWLLKTCRVSVNRSLIVIISAVVSCDISEEQHIWSCWESGFHSAFFSISTFVTKVANKNRNAISSSVKRIYELQRSFRGSCSSFIFSSMSHSSSHL